eukprot:1951769-Amphidinium_carterae.1
MRGEPVALQDKDRGKVRTAFKFTSSHALEPHQPPAKKARFARTLTSSQSAAMDLDSDSDIELDRALSQFVQHDIEHGAKEDEVKKEEGEKTEE